MLEGTEGSCSVLKFYSVCCIARVDRVLCDCMSDGDGTGNYGVLGVMIAF